jgi:hypothetical protein
MIFSIPSPDSCRSALPGRISVSEALIMSGQLP